MSIKWKMDKAHTQVQFKVKHMAISTIWGEFTEVNVEAETDQLNFEQAEFEFSAVIDSIHTGNKDRDAHLKSNDFFDAIDYPEMRFRGRRIADEKVSGELTIRGTTLPIELNLDFGGVIEEGETHRAGMEITGKLNRKDYGLNWSALTEAGNLVVSDTVDLLINLQLLEENTQA